MQIDLQFGTFKGEPTSLTIGSFDGVHKGHDALLNRVIESAKKESITSMVASFDPHPREVLTGTSPLLLSPGYERTELLQGYPLDAHVLCSFDAEMASMEAEDFVTDVLVGMFNVRVLVVGYDHRFGRNRKGDIALLREMGSSHGFSVLECPEVEVGGVTVSSSTIRTLLEDGKVNEASTLIGRRYSLAGTVVHGAGRGNGLGIPTANIGLIADNKLIPRNGVYAVKVEVEGEDRRWNGMMNIGLRPTFDHQSDRTLEVHLIGFNQNIYNREVRVEFAQRVRDERKFDSVDHLLEQLNADRERCTGLLRNIS
jgi:riboflavin kinase/FMN adenylyltransferase